MKYKKYKIVFLDPTANSGWQSEKELKEFTPEECVIEAYVYSKDKKIVKNFCFIFNKQRRQGNYVCRYKRTSSCNN